MPCCTSRVPKCSDNHRLTIHYQRRLLGSVYAHIPHQRCSENSRNAVQHDANRPVECLITPCAQTMAQATAQLGNGNTPVSSAVTDLDRPANCLTGDTCSSPAAVEKVLWIDSNRLRVFVQERGGAETNYDSESATQPATWRQNPRPETNATYASHAALASSLSHFESSS